MDGPFKSCRLGSLGTITTSRPSSVPEGVLGCLEQHGSFRIDVKTDSLTANNIAVIVGHGAGDGGYDTHTIPPLICEASI